MPLSASTYFYEAAGAYNLDGSMTRQLSSCVMSLATEELRTFSGRLSNPLYESEDADSIPEKLRQLPSSGFSCQNQRQTAYSELGAPTEEPAISQQSSARHRMHPVSTAESDSEQKAISRNNVDALLERMQALAQARRALVAQLQVLHWSACIDTRLSAMLCNISGHWV